MGGLDLGPAMKVIPFLAYMFDIMENIINQMFKMFGINLDEVETTPIGG